MIERRRLMQKSGIFDEYGRAIIDGYEVVDLELTGAAENLLFATCNVGATTETEYGYYYMYGKGSRTYNRKDSAYTGTEKPLDPSKDTATVVMGGNWHMPTYFQFAALTDQTTYTWITINGVNGVKFSKIIDGTERYIFFPAAGYYYTYGLTSDGFNASVWSSTPSSQSEYAMFLYCSNNYHTVGSSEKRINGLSVRGVISKSDIPSHQTQLPYTDTVSYLQSSGTQYIKTGINGGPNIKIVIDGAFLSSADSFHGADDGTRKTLIGVYNSKFYLRCGGVGKSVGTADTSRHTFRIESGTVTFDGTSYSVTAYSGIAENGEIYLFADNIQGTVSSYTSFKLYSAKIYSSGTIVRDFIPVRVGQTGCLYDSVSGNVFENQGSGSFSFG